MAKSKSKRKTRSDKSPRTLHKTGQFCKKIKGKLYYFGKDKRVALQHFGYRMERHDLRLRELRLAQTSGGNTGVCRNHSSSGDQLTTAVSRASY